MLVFPGVIALAQVETSGVLNDEAIQVIDKINDRLQALEEKERQQYMLELEGQRKQIDWIIAFLTLFYGCFGVDRYFCALYDASEKQRTD